MNSIPVQFDPEKDQIDTIADAVAEGWDKVCERFDNDVHRIRDVQGHPPYTGLFVCFDDDNRPSHYLVEEDRQLDKMRHRVFLSKLGRKK